MHLFEEIDRKGIEALQHEEFIEHEGMVFRKSAYDTRGIEKLRARGLAEATIQFQMNHQSLISYGGDRAQQLHFAGEIQVVWLERLEKQFPHLYPCIMIEISPSEIILSSRAVRR